MRPIVEVSFMPESLASNASKTIFHYQGGISPPKDLNQWYAFVYGFVQALVARYGVTEVRSWQFEVRAQILAHTR
jgi:xylan 1,4-beta-xylosidase